MQNRIFEEQDIFMKRKPTKYTRELVLDFLNDQSSDFGVATQFELQEKLEAYIAKNQEKYDVVPDQPDISRALATALKIYVYYARQLMMYVATTLAPYNTTSL